MSFQKKIFSLPDNTMVWFADEVFFEINSKISRTWCKKGQKITVKTNGVSGKDCVVGAINPYEGDSFFLQWDWIDSQVIEIFLKKLSELYPDKKHLVVLDNATYHKNQGNKNHPLPDSIELFFLPPYSPDYNFIEILWKVLRDDFFNNKFVKNLLELKDFVGNVLKNVMNTRNIVINVCGVT
jgi:putative transposase